MELFDARDKIAAFANKLGGKGSENMLYYKNCNVTFNDVPNMVSIGSSYKKIKYYISEFCEKDSSKFYPVLADSKWMSSLSLLFKLSEKMTNCLKKGKSVFVHCSDGWDRTSQVILI